MSRITSLLADPTFRAGLTVGLDEPPAADTARLASFVAAAVGRTALALIHYGSHAQRSDARPESARDFFLIVERYHDAYRSLHATVGTSYQPWLAAALNHILPPNVIALDAPLEPAPLRAKIAVLSRADFLSLCSSRARDHFTQGRLFQHVQLVWTRDPDSRRLVLDALAAVRAGTFEWGRAALPPRFDVETYCRVLLTTSFAAEIRPESGERVDMLLAAQRGTMLPAYGCLLARLADTRILASDGKVYIQAPPPGWWAKWRTRMYFRRSKVRATLRWTKYIALYDRWLDYIVQKIARRSGVAIELTPRERRWPLIFLWPKAIHFLRSRPQRRS